MRKGAAAIAVVGAGGAVAVIAAILASRRASARETKRKESAFFDLGLDSAPESVRTSTLPAGHPEPGPIRRPSWTEGGKNDEEALGRVIASEEPSRPRLAELLAIAYAALNRAHARKVSIYSLAAPGGKWGPQGDASRPFSSRQPATATTRSIARWVLAHPAGFSESLDASAIYAELRDADPGAPDDEITEAASLLLSHPGDPTGGAWAFWEPGLQDDFTAKGILYRASGGKAADTSPQGSHKELWRFRRYVRSAAAVRAKWQGDGQRSLGMVGRVELWTAPHAKAAAPAGRTS